MNELMRLTFHQSLFLSLVMLALSIRILTITNGLNLLFAFTIDTSAIFAIIFGWKICFNRKKRRRDKRGYRSPYLQSLRRKSLNRYQFNQIRSPFPFLHADETNDLSVSK